MYSIMFISCTYHDTHINKVLRIFLELIKIHVSMERWPNIKVIKNKKFFQS